MKLTRLSRKYLIILYILFHIILTYTAIGRKIYAVGGNITAAIASGMNVKSVVLFTYTVSGLLAAFAGWILAGRLDMAASHMSTNQLFLAMAAAVMGGVKLGGGQGKIIGMFGGVLLLTAINTFMNLTNISPYIIAATSGFIILVAMIIDALRAGSFIRARM